MKTVSSLSSVASMLLAIRDARRNAPNDPPLLPAVPLMSADQARVLLDRRAEPQRHELRCRATRPAPGDVHAAAALLD